MNEQIPEALKQEAERKYPDETGTFLEMPNKSKVILQRKAYIAGALSRSGGVWVKAETILPEKIIGKPVFGKTNHGGYDVFSWDDMVKFFRPYIHESDEMAEWLDESPAADKGDAIELLKGYEEFEAMLINCNDLWWPNRETDMVKKEIYDKMMKLQEKRNKILQSK